MTTIIEMFHKGDVWWLVLECGHWAKVIGEKPRNRDIECTQCQAIGYAVQASSR